MIESSAGFKFLKSALGQSARNAGRHVYRKGVDHWAGLRGRLRPGALPQVLVIGAQKAGTTTVFGALCETPGVLPPLTKEIGFFDARFEYGEIFYRGFFDPAASGIKSLTAEATPSYLYFPEVPKRVREMLGANVKVVVVLRDPVRRALSHYFHSSRLGYEKKSLSDAIAAEAQRVASVANCTVGDPRRDYVLRHYTYVDRSRYTSCLNRWYEHFPHSQFLILKFENLFVPNSPGLKRLSDFLELDEITIPDKVFQNKGSYSLVDEKIEVILRSHLAEECEHYETWDGINHYAPTALVSSFNTEI